MSPSFPLVATTVSVQLPVQRTWKPAQELLMTPGGTWYLRALPIGEFYEWDLKFAGLIWAEAQTLRDFHHDMRGAYHSFRFCDPLRNLLAWSEDLTQAVWAVSGGLDVTLFANPVAGVAQGVRIVNSGAAEGLASQTVGCAPTFPYSVAATARSNGVGTMGLLIGGQRSDVALTAQWQEFQFSAIPGGSVDQVTFAIAIPQGVEVELAGVQADFGADSPEYRRSEGRQGLFAQARFKDDALVVSCAEAGVFSIQSKVIASVEE
jgi:hypothetical protein